MIRTMVEYIVGVMRMASVGMRELHKQRCRRHGRNEVPWKINLRKELRDDGKWCNEEHDGVYAL